MTIDRIAGPFRGLVVALIVAASLTVAVGSASAGRVDPPGHRDGNQCVNAAGVSVNALYGIPDQFRTRDCRVVSAGEHWIRPFWWVTNNGADSVYPPGYAPARAEPLDDFAAKLVAMEVVTDPHTEREATHVFDGAAILRADIDVEEIEPGAWGAPYPMATLLPRLRPLSVGDHVIEASIVLTDEHCDGFTTDLGLSCLPAGRLLILQHPVTVTTPERS